MPPEIVSGTGGQVLDTGIGAVLVPVVADTNLQSGDKAPRRTVRKKLVETCMAPSMRSSATELYQSYQAICKSVRSLQSVSRPDVGFGAV